MCVDFVRLWLRLCVSVCVSGWLGGFVYSRCKWKSRLKQLLSNYPAKSQNQAFVKRLCTHARQALCAYVCVWVLNSFTCEVSANVCSLAGSLKNRSLKILVDFALNRSHCLILYTLAILLRWMFLPSILTGWVTFQDIAKHPINTHRWLHNSSFK